MGKGGNMVGRAHPWYRTTGKKAPRMCATPGCKRAAGFGQELCSNCSGEAVMKRGGMRNAREAKRSPKVFDK